MKKAILEVWTALLVVLALGNAQAQTCRHPEILRFAVIPQMKDQTALGQYDAIIKTLADELGRTVLLVPVGSYGAVIEGMVDGSIDLAELGPGSYALARDRGADIQAFASLRRETDTTGPSTYHSVLIVRGGVGIHTLDDLRGATVSLVDPASTSGGIVPRVAVQRMTGMMPGSVV